MTYLILKFLHVIGAVVILGPGSDVAFVARTAEVVVRADRCAIGGCEAPASAHALIHAV
jgi:uncharacterized membrane protein